MNPDAIDLINEAIYEIRHYTDPKQADHENWKGIAINAISVILNIPYMTDLTMSQPDMATWRLICKPYIRMAETTTGFTWKEIGPFIEQATDLLHKYGYENKPLPKKATKKSHFHSPKLVQRRAAKPIPYETNQAVANIYLYTLWIKNPVELRKLSPKARNLRTLAQDGLWHLSSLGNDQRFEGFLDLEAGLAQNPPRDFQWTKIVILLQQCGINHTDPIEWLKQKPKKGKPARKAA